MVKALSYASGPACAQCRERDRPGYGENSRYLGEGIEGAYSQKGPSRSQPEFCQDSKSPSDKDTSLCKGTGAGKH